MGSTFVGVTDSREILPVVNKMAKIQCTSIASGNPVILRKYYNLEEFFCQVRIKFFQLPINLHYPLVLTGHSITKAEIAPGRRIFRVDAQGLLVALNRPGGLA